MELVTPFLLKIRNKMQGPFAKCQTGRFTTALHGKSSPIPVAVYYRTIRSSRRIRISMRTLIFAIPSYPLSASYSNSSCATSRCPLRVAIW